MLHPPRLISSSAFALCHIAAAHCKRLSLGLSAGVDANGVCLGTKNSRFLPGIFWCPGHAERVHTMSRVLEAACLSRSTRFFLIPNLRLALNVLADHVELQVDGIAYFQGLHGRVFVGIGDNGHGECIHGHIKYGEADAV